MTDEGSPRELVLALGANLADPLMRLRRAANRLASELAAPRISGVYRTPPENGADQPSYLNAVLRGWTRRSAEEVLALARSIEAAEGRTRPFRGAPRTMDVDVLFLGDLVLDTPELTIPHPRWASRDFVVIPLLDVAPHWRDPVTGRTVAELAGSMGWDGLRFPRLVEPNALLSAETR